MKVTEKYIGEAPLKKSPKKKLSLVIKNKAIDMSKLSDEVITYINESGGAWEGSGVRVKFNAIDNYQEAKQASATNHGTIYFSQGTKPEEYRIFLNGEDYTGLVTLTAGENPGTLIINGDIDHPITIVETSHFTDMDVSNGWLRKFIDGNPTEVAKLVTSYNELTDKLTKSDVETLLQAPNGVATLDNTGKVPSSQLPNYVDDVVDIMGCYNYYDELYRPLEDGKLKLNPTASDFTPDTKIPPTAEPGTYYMALYHTLGGSNPGIYHYVSGMTWTREYGETGKIYIETSLNKQYRFAEEDYTPHEIVASPGTTDDVTEGSINKYFTENRARAAVSEAILQRELLVNKTTTIRGAEEADNTKYPTEKAVRTAIDSKKTSYNDLESNLQGRVDNYDGHIGDAPDMSAKSRGLYKIAITEHGHISDASGSAPTAVVKSDLTGLGVEDTGNKTDVIRTSGNADSTKYPSELAIRTVVDDLDSKIAALSAGVKVSLSISPSVIYKDESESITLTGTMTNGTPTSMKLMDGPTELKTSTSSPISHTVSIIPTANSKSYSMQGVTLGMTLTASASVNARYPIYYGFGTDVASVAISANRYPATTSALNTYTKTAASNGYFYILVPSDIAVPSQFTMGGTPFVMTSSTQIIGSVSYTVYQSGSMYNNGTTLSVVAQ